MLTLSACGGGGGSAGQPTEEIKTFGITKFSVVPNPTNFVFSWINPVTPPAAISNYTVTALAYATEVGPTRVEGASGELNKTIDYTGNNTRQSYTYTNLTEDNYYEFFVTANYADETPSEQIHLFTGRLYAGLNTDGDGLADEQDEDDDNDGVADSADRCSLISGLGRQEIDTDGDTILDTCDIDADGDGLIEIYTVRALNAMRHNLNGTGLDLTGADGDDLTGGEDSGCGGAEDADSDPIESCSGYELMTNIDLNDLGEDASGSNWQPIGGLCESETCNGAALDKFFQAIFDGNHYNISNMRIVEDGRNAIGFFGAVAINTHLKNVHLRDISIDGHLRASVGGLVGFGTSANISHSSVTMRDRITGSSRIGGLIGSAFDAEISFAYVIFNAIELKDREGGGLVGFMGHHMGNTDKKIEHSYAVGGLINGTSGTGSIGGLTAANDFAIVKSSYAIVRDLRHDSVTHQNAALLSKSKGGSIKYSYALIEVVNIPSNAWFGGVGGFPSDSPLDVSSFYWNATGLGTLRAHGAIHGLSKSLEDLRAPVNFGGANNIYAEWGNAWCNPTTGAYMEADSSPSDDFQPAWDLGSSDDTPVLTCFKYLTPDQQRAINKAALAGQSAVTEYNRLRAAE